MAVLVDLHVVAGADPGAVLYLFILVRIEPAGAEWAPDIVDILGEPEDHLVGDPFYGRDVGAGFFTKFLNENAHALDGFLARLVRHFYILTGSKAV